jgi:CheY-like chemotaxis protein
MLSYPELKGLRILIVEDDWLLSKLAEDTVAELGCVVSGTAASVDEALAAINSPHSFDCVILDVRLGQEIAGDIAGKLISKNIPFIVCSGYSISAPGPNIPVVAKPYSPESLATALLTAWRKQGAEERPRI